MYSQSLNNTDGISNVGDDVFLSDEDFNALVDYESYNSNSDSETQQSKDQPASEIQIPVARHFPTIKILGGMASMSTPTISSASQCPQPSCPVSPKAETMDKGGSQLEVSPEQKIEAQLRFLRRKLRKGLLPKDRQPKKSEMPAMFQYLTQLENIPEVSPDVLRSTKIKKVLKHIIKREDIPIDDDEITFFENRAKDLLRKWKANSDSESSARLPNAKPRQSCVPDSTESSVISETPQPIPSVLVALALSDSPSDHLMPDSIEDYQIKKVASSDPKSCVVVLKYKADTNPDAGKPNSMKRKRSGAAGEETGLDLDSSASQRRQRRKITSRQHLNNESTWLAISTQATNSLLKQEVEKLRVVTEKKKRQLEEISAEQAKIEESIRTLNTLKENLVAWGAEDEKVTNEWAN